jgi:valyl-tRNA synthetase
MGMLLTSPAGNDLPFDESLIEQGRNFNNKIWNAFRLIKGFDVDPNKLQPENNKLACAWFESRFNQQLAVINDLYSKYRMSEVLMTTYKLVWDDFCAWYLEMIKPDFVDGKAMPIDAKTLQQTINYFGNLLKLLHPFMPFITEELWHLIEDRKENDCILISPWPAEGKIDESILTGFAHASEVIQQIRNIRNQKGLSPKEQLQLIIKNDSTRNQQFDAIVQKSANLSRIESLNDKSQGALNFMVGTVEYFVPLAQSIDINTEKAKYVEELNYLKGFLESVNKKLSNEKFVANAKPEVIANERKKMDDAQTKIKMIEEQMAALSV